MAIDWFTVGAQVVNFLVLVALLKHFLYGPIQNALDRREDSIRSRLEDAERREAEATEARRAFEERRRDLEAEEEAIRERAREEAAEERRRRLEAAKEEVARSRERWLESLERERSRVADDTERTFVRLFFEVGRRALADLAGVDLEDRILEVFLTRLEDLDEEDRGALEAAVSEQDAKLVVETGFELDGERRERVAGRIRERLGLDAETPLAFEPDAELVCGVALRAAGRRVGWSVEGYLRDWRERALARLEEIEHGA